MAVALICEFNPFHNGHKYIIGEARRLTGEPVVAIMSGSFTQRGEAAICSKFDRARMALENGADLVVELPTVYAVAGAQRFAQGGVEIAKSFGEVRWLAFGCECGDAAALARVAQALEQPAFSQAVRAQLSMRRRKRAAGSGGRPAKSRRQCADSGSNEGRRLLSAGGGACGEVGLRRRGGRRAHLAE